MIATADYVAALRTLLDLVEAHPELPLPAVDPVAGVRYFCRDTGDLAKILQSLGNRSWAPNDAAASSYDAVYLTLSSALGDLPVSIVIQRSMLRADTLARAS